MEKTYSTTSKEISDYVIDLFRPEDGILEQTRKHLIDEGLPNEATVHAMDGRHLEVLSRAVMPSRIVEIGTLGGYSTICLARGLRPGGKLFALEISEKNASVARENLKRAEMDDRVEIIVGDALSNLTQLKDQGPFDIVFIDADKASYPQYLTWAEKNLRIGGMVIGDNTFYFDKILSTDYGSGAQEKSIKAMREFNQRLAQSPFRSTIFPTGEGMTVGIRIQ